MKKKLMAWLLAGTMTASAGATSLAWAGSSDTSQTGAQTEEEITDTEQESGDAAIRITYPKLSIANEWDLRSESGRTLREWDESIDAMKKSGRDSAFTQSQLHEADPGTQILEDEDGVYYISKNKAIEAVHSVDDAYERLYQLLPVLGGSENTDMRLVSELGYNDNLIYTFQQVSDGETVLGSVVKIAADKDGNVSAVFSGLVEDADGKGQPVAQEEAEDNVRAYMQKEFDSDAEVLSEYTDRIYYQQDDMESALNLDVEEDPVPDLVLWTVFTQNPDRDSDYPYLAHYLRMDGAYEFSLPVSEPNDEESRTGYRRQDVFAGMTEDSYTGEITDIDGEAREITVPVMHSEEDGRWYLGDAKNRIAVADFKTAAYGDDHELVLVGTDDNTGWDNEDLFMFYNYLRAYMFYKNMGWDGPDGRGTDVIILKDMCTSSGAAFENACSIGNIENYCMFGYTGYDSAGEPLGLVKGLDVMAHEFTHTFTGTVMNENLYENDLGAINEAMSDIMGNLCEFIYDDTDDTEWMLGENTGSIVRSMSDPHFMTQPEYVWDVYYGPNTDRKSDANDRGGVHINSSLLNRIAAMLCLNDGMSLEEAVSMWSAAAMGMTPLADYPRIAPLLRWALEVSGNESYRDSLDSLIKEERLESTGLPDKLPLGQKLCSLTLPDTEAFQDDNWGLLGVQLNAEIAGQLIQTAVRLGINMFTDEKNRESFGDIVKELLDSIHMTGKDLKIDNLDNLMNDDDKMVDAITDISVNVLPQLINQTLAWPGEGTNKITFVTQDSPTFYMLFNVTESGTKVNGAAVLAGDRWIDVGKYAAEAMKTVENAESKSESIPDISDIDLDGMADDLMKLLDSFAGDEEDEDTSDVLEEENGYDTVDLILAGLDNVINVVEYLNTPEEDRPESLDSVIMMPAVEEKLPTKGLDKVQLIA